MSSINQIQSPIGVAIAGLGFGEAVHLPALKANPELKPVALWHPRNERLQKACKEHDLTGHNDWSALLADPKVEAIILATPPGPRFELAQKALEAGKHLLLEKPVALHAEQVATLQRLAIGNRLSVAVDFEYRAVPLFMQAKRLLAEGAVGTPWLVKLDWLMSSRANASRPWNWYSQVEAGGGVIGALGTHAFDILHWLFGPTQSINGLLSTSIKERPDPKSGGSLEVSSEDVALAQLKLNSIEASDLPAQVSLTAIALQGRGCWLEIYGSKGSILLGSDNQKDYVHGFDLKAAVAGEPLRSISPDADLVFPSKWSDGRIAPVARIQGWWAESIRSGHPMVPGLAEGWASQQVCDKLRDSAASSQQLSIKSTI